MRIKKTNYTNIDLKKKNLLVSILITNFNKEKFIEKTLQSCVNQNFREKQILVYDDASTDNSYNIIKKFKGIKIIINKKKKLKTAPLNQISGIIELFKKSLHLSVDQRKEMGKKSLEYFKENFIKEKIVNKFLNAIK